MSRVNALRKIGAPVPDGQQMEAFSYCCRRNVPVYSSTIDHHRDWLRRVRPHPEGDQEAFRNLLPFAYFGSFDEMDESDPMSGMAPQRRLAFLYRYPDAASLFGPQVPQNETCKIIREVVDNCDNMMPDIVDGRIQNYITPEEWSQFLDDPAELMSTITLNKEDPDLEGPS